ncbi:hypothetical protein [Flavobacterium notoginsengisoli]|uniref:hypothetical protein n=1 Tax=Flavobacterium notoginsengisoli TaxID=1478199 RepID=UPI00363C1E76
MINNKYPLEWLDYLVLQHFNPAKTDVSMLSEADLAVISENATLESSRIQVRVKNEIFAMRRKRQIRLLVRKYHSTLIYLMDHMAESSRSASFQRPEIVRTAEIIMKCLDELLSFLENRYTAYLNLDEKVPVSYLLVFRKEMQLKLKKMQHQKHVVNSGDQQEVLKIVNDELAAVLSLKNRNRLTFRQTLYQKTVVRELESLGSIESESVFFSVLDRRLIALNFNSKSYINLLLKRVSGKVDESELISEKLSLIAYCFKEFSQIETDCRLFFNGDMQSLRTVVENWFRYEIEYYEKLMKLSALETENELHPGHKNVNKLECDLSADQIGIILRAADEARVVKSRSMTLVFQRIVPHLSTTFKKDLSYQSVRSKSYNAEENDKNIAILTLEKMIRKIKSY